MTLRPTKFSTKSEVKEINSNTLTPEKEIELINSYTSSPLTYEQVFCFTVTLCDNEVDRDFERFTLKALEELRVLFVGKTGISDHSMRSKDQMARIFHTYIENDTTKKTTCGEPYTVLKARAYMVRTEENRCLISEIEGGIKKEVSISCSVNKSTCSICGNDMKVHSCKHIKGRTYEGKLCYAKLSEPTDAYEWSFVAVPAQRNAGVSKSFRKKDNNNLNNPSEVIKSMESGCVVSQEELECIKDYVAHLEALAEDAKTYKQHLLGEIERLALITMPKVNFKSFILGCENLKNQELKNLKEGLEAQAREVLPPEPQLKALKAQPSKNINHTSFKI